MLKQGQKRNEKGHIDTEDMQWVEQLQDGKPIVTSDIDKLAFIKTEMLVEAGAEDDTGHRGYKFEYYEEGGHGLYSLTVTDIKTDKTVYSMNDFDEINDMVESGYLDISDPEAFIDYLIDDVSVLKDGGNEEKEKNHGIKTSLDELTPEQKTKHDELMKNYEVNKVIFLNKNKDKNEKDYQQSIKDQVYGKEQGTPATQKGKRGGEWYIDTKGKRRYVKKSNLKVVSADDMSFNADAPIGSRFGFEGEKPDVRAGESKEQGQHGFDYTHFGVDPQDFKDMLKNNGISEVPEEYSVVAYSGGRENSMFVWKGDGIEMVTGHDPIAGDHSIGYAGDIGIRGDADKVAKLVAEIKERGDIKTNGESSPGVLEGESVGELGFIGFPSDMTGDGYEEYTVTKVKKDIPKNTEDIKGMAEAESNLDDAIVEDMKTRVDSNVDANTEKLRELGRQAYIATRDKNKEQADSIAAKLRGITDGLSGAEKVFVAKTVMEGHDEEQGHNLSDSVYRLQHGEEQYKKPIAEPVAEKQPDVKKGRSKKFDLGFGHLGNGLAVWNRAKEVNGDYEAVAHIDSDRKITWRIKDVPEEVKSEVERVANGPNMGVSTSQPEQKVFRDDAPSQQSTEPAWQKGRKYKGQEAYYIVDPKSGRRIYKKRGILELLKIAQKLEADGLTVEAAELDKIVMDMEVPEIKKECVEDLSNEQRIDILFKIASDALAEQNGTDIMEVLTTEGDRTEADSEQKEETRKIITAMGLSLNTDVSAYVERLDKGENVRQILCDFAVNTSDEKRVMASLRCEAEEGFTFNSNAPEGERFGVGKEDRIAKARELGEKAFRDGKKRVPAQNKELMDMIQPGTEVGKGDTMAIMTAFTKAWDKANLSNKVGGVEPEENLQKDSDKMYNEENVSTVPPTGITRNMEEIMMRDLNSEKPSTEMQKSDEERARELGSAFSKAQDSKHSNPEGMADISIEWHKMMEGKTEEEKKKLSDAFVAGGKEMTKSKTINTDKDKAHEIDKGGYKLEKEPSDFNAPKELKGLSQFIGNDEMMAIKDGLKGEEKSYFADKIKEMSEVIKTMPKTYEQDGKGDAAVAYLHYFKGGADFYITEKDMGDEQIQAFGLADLGHGSELGYISIQELLDNGMELDLHFKPKTIGEIKSGTSEKSAPVYQKGRKYKGQEAEYYIDPKTQKRVYKGH